MKKSRSRSRRRSLTSITSSSTATSRAWLTAPASRWRRWTSSSSRVVNPRIFSTSAVARRILLADKNVRAVLINIFGGIVRCDMVARGVVEAARNLGINVPVVVRLEGTNVEEGQRVIRDSGMNFTVANGMKDAAEKVVGLAA